jgi:hypothetical protein
MPSTPTVRSTVRRAATLAGAAFASAALLVGAIAAPALAADPVEPPPPPTLEGVVFDATLAVTFHAPADAGGGPLGGAEVTVLGTRDGETIMGIGGFTDETGLLVLSDLPRATDGAPILLSIAGSWYEAPTSEECQVVNGWAASTDGIVSGIDVAVYLEGLAASIELCGGGTGGGGGIDLAHVVFDGELTVSILDDAGAPRAGADVSVAATIDGGDMVWWDAAAADADGRVVFVGLPRPDAEGPPITWALEATAREEFDVAGCTFQHVWTGALEAVASAAPVEVEVGVLPSPEVAPGTCAPPPDGSPLLSGRLRDPDGGPVAGAVRLTQIRADGGSWAESIDTAGDGTFQAAVHAWGTAGAPSSIRLEAVGPQTRTEVVADCTFTYGLRGVATLDVALADDPTLAVVDVPLAEGLTGQSCPGAELGDPPATDTDPRGGGAPPSLLVTVAALGFAAALRRSGRRETAA